jgi:hypothetical protein
MLEVFDGHMLGDGYIDKPCSPTVPGARFGIHQKYRQFAEWIAGVFDGCDIKLKDKSQYDKRTGKTYYYCIGRSLHHPDIRRQYDRWYPNGKKTIPSDVRLTPMSVMVWYLGDGTLERSRGDPRIMIACEGFPRENVSKILFPFLDGLSPGQWRHTKRNNLRSLKSGDAVLNLMAFIGWDSPVRCYDYKFMSHSQIQSIRDKTRANIERSRKEGLAKAIEARRASHAWTNEEVLALRRQGLSYPAIESKLGISFSYAQKICRDSMTSEEYDELNSHTVGPGRNRIKRVRRSSRSSVRPTHDIFA